MKLQEAAAKMIEIAGTIYNTNDKKKKHKKA